MKPSSKNKTPKSSKVTEPKGKKKTPLIKSASKRKPKSKKQPKRGYQQIQNKTPNVNCQWTVSGPQWQWIHKGKSHDDPVEIATMAVEQLYGKKEGLDDDKFLIEDPNDIEIGFLFVVEHSKMKDVGEKMAIYSPIVLANAGLYSLAEEIKNIKNPDILEEDPKSQN